MTTGKTMDLSEAEALVGRAVENPLAPVSAHDLAMAVAVVMVRHGLLGFHAPVVDEQS